MDSAGGQALPGGVFIVANPADIALLRASSASDTFGTSAFTPLTVEAPLPDNLVADARVLVLEVNPNDLASVRRLSQIRSKRSDLPIIAAIQDANISLVRTLVRQGISDVAVLPFVPEELSAQIIDAFAKIEKKVAHAALCPMVTVVRSIGGCGATSVITHLAAALAQADNHKKICVIDLDLQCGEVASYLGQTPDVTVSDLLEAGERFDHELLRNALIDSQRGFSIISAPSNIMPLEDVEVEQLLNLIRSVRTEFDYVLLDLPTDWTNWTLSVALASTDVIMITDLSIASLKQAKRRIELLAYVGVTAQHMKVVVNRVERKLFKPIGVAEVREALDCDVLTTLAAEGASISSAQDQGLLLTEISPKCRFGADIRTLARLLTEKKG